MSLALGSRSEDASSAEETKGGDALPKHWRWVTLGDVTESMKNGIYKPASSYAEDGLACLRMYNIGEGRIVWRDIKTMRLSEDEIREYELLPGDILVNRVNSRELVGKAVAIPMGLERCIFESKNIRVRIRRDLASPEYVSYRLLSAGIRQPPARHSPASVHPAKSLYRAVGHGQPLTTITVKHSITR